MTTENGMGVIFKYFFLLWTNPFIFPLIFVRQAFHKIQGNNIRLGKEIHTQLDYV